MYIYIYIHYCIRHTHNHIYDYCYLWQRLSIASRIMSRAMQCIPCTTYRISSVTYHASRVTCHRSRVTHHTSHITHHTSHITHHTSHTTHHSISRYINALAGIRTGKLAGEVRVSRTRSAPRGFLTAVDIRHSSGGCRCAPRRRCPGRVSFSTLSLG